MFPDRLPLREVERLGPALRQGGKALLDDESPSPTAFDFFKLLVPQDADGFLVLEAYRSDRRSKRCRVAYHAEARQAGYRMIQTPTVRPDRPVPARHARPMSFWRAGVEVATGRRIHMTIMSPSQLLDTLPKRDLTPEMGTITP